MVFRLNAKLPWFIWVVCWMDLGTLGLSSIAGWTVSELRFELSAEVGSTRPTSIRRKVRILVACIEPVIWNYFGRLHSDVRFLLVLGTKRSFHARVSWFTRP